MNRIYNGPYAYENPQIDKERTGKHLKDIRVHRGIERWKIAEFLGFTSDRAVYKWESGETLPDIGNLLSLSQLFQLSIDELIVDTRESEDSLSW